jgi:hypothetical protein
MIWGYCLAPHIDLSYTRIWISYVLGTVCQTYQAQRP